MKPHPPWLMMLGFCLLIFGAKLWFIDVGGSDLPTWDQWDAQSENVLRPWLEGGWHIRDVFQPHNEHRLVTTKLYSLGLFIANGQWDCFLETTANAAVHTLCALLLLLLARRWLAGIWLGLFAALLVLLFTLPFSWENTLCGFQVQFYFLLLFSLGHVWLTLEGDRFGGRWAVGQLSGGLAVITMASGFLSGAAILAVLGHRLVRERRWSAQQITTAGLALVSCIAGWLLKYEVPGHAVLHARGPGQFAGAFLELLAWPGSTLFPWALVLFAPAVIFLVRRIRSQATSADDAILLGLQIWLLLQCLALAAARGGGGTILAPRYLDLLTVNLALGWIFLAREFSGRVRRWLAAVWLAAVAAGLIQQSCMMWRDNVEPDISRHQRQEGHVRDFLRTRDPAHLLNQPWGDVPYPDGGTLVQRLASPAIQAIMPPSVRRSIPVSNGAPTILPATAPAAIRPIALSTWSLPAHALPFHWRSAPQSAGTLPVLRFRIAGDLGRPGYQGQLVVRSAAGTVLVEPDSAPGNYWKNVSVFRPAGEWWLEVTAADSGTWFAFTEPVDVGRLTWVAEKLLKYHFLVIAAGLTLLACGALPQLRRPRP